MIISFLASGTDVNGIALNQQATGFSESTNQHRYLPAPLSCKPLSVT